jgi:hypothetical protein
MIIFLNTVSQLIFQIQARCVFFDVGTELLNTGINRVETSVCDVGG